STYAAYLRRYSERRGVMRREGKIVDVRQNGETGLIEAVQMNDGSLIRGDFFVDCSGFRGLLIEHVYKAGFEDWSEWLPNDRAALAEPKILRFKAGRRKASWVKNCLALGLSSGFLEPLESTSIHLVQAAIMKFLDFFPGREPDQILIDRFNEEMRFQYESIRDFIIAHYKVT